MLHSAEGSKSPGRLTPLSRILVSASRLAALGVALVCVGFARADEELNPKTYNSPNGEFTLRVEPTNPEGAGPARYEVKHKGKPVWSGEEPFTLWDAAITDTGVVAGFGYQHGRDGRPYRDHNSKTSYLYSVIIDERGLVRLKDELERRHPKMMSNPPSPYEPRGLGVLVEPSGDRFVVRLSGEWPKTDEHWRVFRLSTGESMPEVTPDQPQHEHEYGFHIAVNCVPVAETPLYLFQWCMSDSQVVDGAPKRTNSAQVALLTALGECVWKQDYPEEYEKFGKNFSWYWNLVRPGIEQSGVGRGSFWFHSFSYEERIGFAIHADEESASGWRVEEVSREKAGPPQPAAAPGPAIVDEAREPLGVISLEATVPGAADSPLHSLVAFEIGTDARFGLIRRDRGEQFLIADESGRVVLERDLMSLGKGISHLAAMPNGCWMVYSSGVGDEGANAWKLDPSAPDPQFKPIAGLEVGALKDVAALPDGGFVALSGPNWVYSDSLTAFDGEGKIKWSERGRSTQGVAVTTDGRVALLEGGRNHIRLFDLNGKELETVNLTQEFGQKPQYVAGLSQDRDGGLIVFDFAGSPQVYRLSREMKLLGAMQPTYTDGGKFRVVGLIQSSPLDGRYWVCSGDGLLRMDDQGKADKTLGEAASEVGQPLRRINALCLDHLGRMYAVNGADNAVHVYDADGSLLRILKPNTDDFKVEIGFGSICVQGDGTVRYKPTGFSGGFLRFDPQGQRAGMESGLLGEVGEEWHAIPGTGRRWAVGYSSIALIDEAGAVVQRFTNRPDGAWLGRVSDGAVAPEGSFVVISGPSDRGSRGPAFACVYSNTAEPIATLPVPVDTTMVRVAFNGRTVALTSQSEVFLLSLDGGATRRFALPKEEGLQDYWYLLSSADGKELLANRAMTTELLRYAFD